MRVLLTVAVLAVLAFTCSTVSAADADSDVVVLTADTFDDAIKAHDISLVEFFAPWCGHCKQLAPEYAKAATELKGSVQLASVDCTTERDLCGKYEVRGFPTMKIFRKESDKPSEYQGGRKAPDIVKFMKKQTEPAFQVLDTDAKVDEFASNDDRVGIIGFVDSLESDAGKAFLATANAMRNEFTFGVSTDAAAATKYGATVPGAVLFKFEDGKVVNVAFSGSEFTTETLQKFVKAEAFPLVGDIGPENFQQYLDRGLPLVWVFVDLSADATKSVLSAAAEAAREFKGRLSVVKLDGVRWGEHAKHFGLSGKLPGIVAEDRDNNKNYVFDESKEPTASALKEHFKGFVDGTLTPTLKSEEIPANNDGPVTTLVGKNFEQIVFDESKDVFVEFYAPWCGHCKSLAPKWTKLGEQFADVPSVVIAQVDATANDTPYPVQGFPTLVFWPAGDKKKPVPYEGDRTVEAMEAFVREHAATLKQAGGETAAPAGATGTGHDEL